MNHLTSIAEELGRLAKETNPIQAMEHAQSMLSTAPETEKKACTFFVGQMDYWASQPWLGVEVFIEKIDEELTSTKEIYALS